ncbi:uncharacterized protein P884DRAFT_124518 [Thermothelomyces heterothallicus CBS 202.75]|uniref:uncharacterized protein n=1 Tax=Thermothelomyces heterothallicus CBS 202.75 TaxID=1149848 RepID=UPI00374327DF
MNDKETRIGEPRSLRPSFSESYSVIGTDGQSTWQPSFTEPEPIVMVDCQPLASASSTVSRAEAEHSTARIGSREVVTRLRMKRKHCVYGSYRFMIAFFSPSCICIKMYASLIGGKHTKFQGC